MSSKTISGGMKRGYFEYFAYGIVLIILISFPLIFWDYSDLDQRRRIIGGWIRIFPFILIFLVHNFWLLPGYLLKKKFLAYFLGTLILILLVNYLFIYNEYLHDVLFNLSRPHGPEGSVTPDFPDKLHQGRGPGRGGEHGHMSGRGQGFRHWHNPVYLVYTYNMVISFLVVGFNVAIKLTTEWFRDEQQRKEIEKETIQTQLTALQHQVSPHFFMNTLNNIHALIDYSKEDAKEAILRLSRMMRYLLYDSEQGTTSLTRELEFLKSYLDLMRLRLQKSVELKVNFPSSPPGLEVHPFLLIAFIENAFKHGIRPRGKSFIHILLEINHDKLHFNVINSRADGTKDTNNEGGIGIENTRKRLDLLYGRNYSLNIYDRKKDFEIDLIIPVR